MAERMLRSGDKGSEVVRLQTMLNRELNLAPPLSLDGDFGPKTEAAVRKFQTAHGLVVDGIVGPKTWGELHAHFRKPAAGQKAGTPPTQSHVAANNGVIENAVKTAITQVGVMEQPLGSNRGTEVDAYNKCSGAPAGSYWCMSFVYWCFDRAAKQAGEHNPMPRTASCDYLYDWAKSHGKLAKMPQRGDIFLVRDAKGHSHTGIVIEGTAGGFTSVEGNTNNDGSNNGIGVFRRHRRTATCDYVRLGVSSYSPSLHAPPAPGHSASTQIAWGAKVSTEFKAKVIQICTELGIDPSYLMACMAFETGETFRADIKNAAGSGATGLIQFMPSTASGLGTSTGALAAMTPVQQLDYVKKYFQSHTGKLNTLEDVYMAILYPAAIGKPADSTLFAGGTKAYSQNSGFDKNQDNRITPAEVSALVRQKYNKGMGSTYKG